MATRTGHAVRANLRIWWPELLVAAMLTAIAFAGQKDDPLFAIFCGLIGAIFWALGFRHRHRPIVDVIRRMDAKLDQALGDDDRPLAEVRHIHSV
jgi:hypothetical protein